MPFAHFSSCERVMTGICDCQDLTVELIIRAIDLESRSNASRDESVARLETRLEAENAARLENIARLKMEVGSIRAMVRSLQVELGELDPQLLPDQTGQATTAAAATAAAATAATTATIIIIAMVILSRPR